MHRLQRRAGIGAELVAQRPPVGLVAGQRRGRAHRRGLAAQQLEQHLLVARSLAGQLGQRLDRLGRPAEPGQGERAGPEQRPVRRRALRPQRGDRVVRAASPPGGPVPQREAGLGVRERGGVVAGARHRRALADALRAGRAELSTWSSASASR